ncbi:dynein axonemal intermediate chain 7 homolog [Penaeus chinensis]|uniref:dynein axonemal intermediate chain 7 homolog n=1 Tax=Penaeus chinensis TaxID=139456 RepID=UPI001FB7DA77|nr:dynein axonemal intermediate chain 7 homolog [Penaeus chinensis]
MRSTIHEEYATERCMKSVVHMQLTTYDTSGVFQKEAEEAARREEQRREQKRQRKEQLRATGALLQELDQTMELTRDRIMEEEEWERMMRCDGLPDPTSVPEMNRYLSLWQADPASATLEGALAKTDQVIHVSDFALTLDDLEAAPGMCRNGKDNKFLDKHKFYFLGVISELENVMEETRDATEKQLRDWKEIWLELQEAQKGKLDQATYHQLLDLRPHLDHETMVAFGDCKYCNTLQVYSFFTSSPLVSLALWSNTTRSPKNNNHQLALTSSQFRKVKELGFTFTLPADLSEAECVVRVMRTEYDHYSKFARTYNPPLVPETCGELIDEEEPEETPREDPPADKEEVVHALKTVIKVRAEFNYSNYMRVVNKVSIAITTDISGSKGDKDKDKDSDKDSKGAPQTSTKKAKPPHYTDTAAGELNLRRYRVQGGVYTVDLLEVPPQPRVLADCTITQVEEVCTVSKVEWVAQYNPPAPAEAGGQRRRDPEAVEQEMRQLEKEMKKLLLITIKLPDSAFWFEPPQMVLWDENKRCWSTDYFHDVKYNEDQCVMQVRTMRLGVMGLAMNRYANLPFQSWELKPKGASSVTLTLIAAVVVADFTITVKACPCVREGQVCLANLQDGARTALSHLYGKNMKPGALIKTLQFYGINLFPDRDSYCYIDGLPTKHRPTEQHLYRCMALVAPAVHFAWSRWNLLAGKTKLVFQMKTKKLLTDESQPLVLVTPQRTCVLECTEISQSFSNNPEEPNKYYADLYQMVLGDLGSSVRQTVEAASPVFIHTIHSMLKSASVISYC